MVTCLATLVLVVLTLRPRASSVADEYEFVEKGAVVGTHACSDYWFDKLKAAAFRQARKYNLPIAMAYAGPDGKGGNCSMGFTVTEWETRLPLHNANAPGQNPSRTGRADFLFGSFTKVWTSSAILKLWNEGKIDIDKPAYKYMASAYERQNRGGSLTEQFGDNIKKVTIRQLLSMRGNIEDYDEIGYQRKYPTEDLGPADTVKLFGAGKMSEDRPLGSCGVYSSMSYVLLGLVLNGHNGTSWDEYDQNVWKEYFPNVRFGVRGPCSTYTDVHGECAACLPHTPASMSCTSGYTCGNLIAPVEEVARFAHGVFSGALLGSKTTADMIKGTPLGNPGAWPGVTCRTFDSGDLYGLGVENHRDPRFPGHEGVTYGFTSLTKYDRLLKGAWVAAIATSNEGMDGKASSAWRDLYQSVRHIAESSKDVLV